MKINLQRLVVVLSLFFTTGLSNAKTVLLNENFSSGIQPVGWMQDSAGVTPFFTWSFINPGSAFITGAGFDTSFVIFDSDYHGQNNSENCYLNLPAVNASLLTTVYLVMDQQFRSAANQYHQVEVSNDNGSSWTPLLQDSVSGVGYPNAENTVLDITSVAAGQSNVKIRFHYVATWGWWWAIDNVEITDSVLCSSPPDGGRAIADVSYSCGTDSFSLSLTNYSFASGHSYQWQSSANGLTWADISGAVNTVFTCSQSIATFYRCVVTCSSLSSNSDSVLVEINPNLFCYCIPYNTICTGVDYITNVSISGTSLNNSSGCDSSFATNYSYYPPAGNMTASLDAGTSVNVNVTTNNNDVISIWIDYDHNRVFDDNEWAQICTTSVAGIANSVSLPIPSTALNGLTGLRIRSRSVGSMNDSTSACTPMGSGETEDYIITIDNGIGIQETLLRGVKIFPSPTTGQIEINFGNDSFDHVWVRVIDLMGSTLMQKSTHQAAVTLVDLSGLANGFYFINVETGNRSIIQKVVLNK